ncbi:GAF and ANTAR domain-containing protein [Rhodococcus sp. BL-253-APC-6A1W]|uniref:GAF and ANTAR domain-containing protein n=1 Tax=Rhodococcus sp. BL-253-APC-6A1W TaxID=2725307 RepID=UPI003211D547
MIVRVDDVGTDPRWPLWSARVDSTGIRSVLSAPLVTADRSWGAIKVYSDRAGAYDETEVGLLRRFAAQAAILVANVHTFRSAERLSDNLKRALHTRDLIATAKGIVMLREQLDPDQAMRWLIEQSSLSGTTLATLAETLVEGAGDEAG